MNLCNRLLMAVLLMSAAAGPAAAQIGLAPEAKADAQVAADSFGRETPRAVVTGLIRALAEHDYSRAGVYFDIPTKGDQQAIGADLARRLQAVLDVGGTLTPFAILSNNPTGETGDGLPPDEEQVGRFSTGGAEVPIILSRAQSAEGVQIWRISRETIAALRKQTSALEQAGMREANPTGFSVAGAPLWDWLLLLGAAAGSFIVFWLIGAAIVAVIRIWVADREQSSFFSFLKAAMPPLSLYLAVGAFYIWAGQVSVAIVARQTLLRYAGIVAWIAIAWFALRFVDAAAKLAIARMQRAERRQAVSVITLVRRSAKVILLAVALVAILDTLGVDVTTGIAALGIGGLALALGAQRTIENLVGSVTVIADRPVQVGDFCRVGDVVGTVEDIGMRSTRIRTNERTVVTIPNGNFSALQIENFSRRDRFLFNPTIGVEYGISADKLRRGVEIVEEVLKGNELIDPQGARARFTNFGDSSLDIEIFSYILVSDFAESLVVRQQLLLEIMARLEAEGLGIAFPTRTVHIRSDAGEFAPELLTQGKRQEGESARR